MKSLASDLKEKKKLGDRTIISYMRSLKISNCKTDFDSLEFLKKKKQVEECLKPYKEGSKKAIVTAICSVLKLYGKDELHKYYYEKLVSYSSPVTHEKTEAQKDNWMEWDQILAIKKDLESKNDTHENRLKHMVLSLYTELQPRRVMDYVIMYVVPKIKSDLATDKNYVALKENVFVFNRYKTDKKYGQQKIEIPAELRKSIDAYLEHHPLKKNKSYPLLVTKEGSPYSGSSSITMMLNRIFKKKISASMLRHIYLSHKYNIDAMEKDAEIMGHSLSEQRNYLRKD